MRVLGENHPSTQAARSHLAAAWLAAGDLSRAISLLEQVLSDRKRILGPDHPDTLGSHSNLAYAYQEAGDLGRAIPMYEQALTDPPGSSAKITLILWLSAITSPAPTGRQGTWAVPSPCTNKFSPTGNGSWAQAIQTPWLHAADLPPPTSMAGI